MTKQTPPTPQRGPAIMQESKSQACTPTDPFLLKLNCFVKDIDSLIEVKILSDEPVRALKKAIQKEKENEIYGIDADRLTLKYIRDGADVNELSVDTLLLMSGIKSFNFYFPNMLAAPTGRVHILVKLPQQDGKRKAETQGDERRSLKRILLGHKLKLRGLIELYPTAVENYTGRGMMDQTSHTIFLVPGGSGIGKTRAAYELRNLITHIDKLGININLKPEDLEIFRKALIDPIYLYINLNIRVNYDEGFDQKYTDGAIRLGA
ncbi:hypothetical protein BGZ76_011671 [Entomortierella beljakovae]|nr:hypothetical protein BGZ76_011671 [Entomortierella beljakovae]